MDNMIFWKGLITGLILSLPFGPMGIYCMEKTLSEGEKQGLVSAMGLITCDMVYGLVALIFMNKVNHFIHDYSKYFTLIVAIFLIVIGFKKLKSKVELHESKDREKTLLQDYMSTFGLAIMNITGILVIVGIYTVLGVHEMEKPDMRNLIGLISGIFTGGVTLWCLTVYLLSHWRKKFTDETITWISRITGGVILGFGIFAFLGVFIK